MPQVEGAIIGDRYRLVRKIGEGGMASVWEAEHVQLHNRLGVKFLHRTAPKGTEAADRFLREARVAAQVKHRNVVDINDFGFTEEDVPYMVMELLVGKPLSDHLLMFAPLDFDEAARLVSLTLRGLAAVHDAGIVHRDLKPDNIFLVHDEDGDFPKLLDFGLSRRAGRSNMTMEGTLMGTPDYMSPEQARGMTDLDARTDIYSMGVILYEMITNRMPYESEHIGDLIAMIARDPPTPLVTHRPDAPPELVQVIERAMAKDREERFADAREMRDALVEIWGGFQEPASGLTALSELPGSPDGPTSSKFRRPTPPSGARRGTGSGVGINPATRRTGSQVGAIPSVPRASFPENGDATSVDFPVSAVDPARRALEDAPTMHALEAIAAAPAAIRPAEEGGPRSLAATMVAAAIAAGSAATLAWVWIANGDGDGASAMDGAPVGAPFVAGDGGIEGGADAALVIGREAAARDAGSAVARETETIPDAGIEGVGETTDDEEAESIERPAKQRAGARRGGRVTKRRGGRRR